MHQGTITECDDKVAHCKVQCDNGDEEEFEEHKIEELLIGKETTDCYPPTHHTHKETLQLEMTLDTFDPSTTIKVAITNVHDLGFQFHTGKYTPTIIDCEPGSPANTI